MAASIGIDLGTTNSVCACTVAGVTRVLANRERGTLTPSVVARHKDGSLLVGTTAVRTAKSDPLNVIFSIKRLMGRRYNDKEVEIVQKHVSYRIVPPKDGGTGMAHVMIGDKLYSPIEVSALILEKIKKDAELALGDAVTHAVITVPAYFDDNQREATRQAGGLAGLKVKRIIDEPTAAAYAFGVDLDTSAAKAIVVYDLGGGTFDISVIFIGAGVPTVESIDGDIWLGGDKFDNYIIDFVLKKYPAHSADLRKDAGFMLDLKQQSEQAKKDLAGGAPSTEISIAAALRGRVDVEVEIRNEEFERMIEEDIAGSLVKVDDALRGANMSVAEIDHVLLVGGSTRLPLVRRLLAKKFGAEKIRATVDPMECVALGAAILASRSEKKFCPKRNCGHENEPDAAKCVGCEAPLAEVEAQVKCPHCNELHAKYEVVCPTTGKSLVGAPESVTAKPIGIGVEGDRFEIVVPKGTRYPATEPISVEFKTVSDFQDWIIIPIYQGSEPTATRNELQGEIVIPENGPIPQDKRVPKDTAVDVGFEINENGTLTIQVSGKGDLKWLKVGKVVRPWEDQPKPAGGGDGDTVRPQVACSSCKKMTARGKAVCEHCGEPMESGGGDGGGGPKRAEWQQDLLFWVNFANVAIREFDWCLPPASIEAVQRLVSRSDRIMETGDEAGGRVLKTSLEAAMNQHCGGILDLVEAAWVRRLGLGQLDQSQRLGGMLDEYKRRALQNESPASPPMKKLRADIAALKQEIFGGLNDAGKVTCAACGKKRTPPSPMTPKCEHCGNNPLILKKG